MSGKDKRSKSMIERNGRKKILIVENNDIVLSGFEELFAGAGFDIRATWSGYEALALMKTQEFDAVLADEYLADIHFTDFLKRVARLPRATPIIMMQGREQARAELPHYDSLGVDAVVNKRDRKHVRQVVASFCRHGQAPRATVN